ALHPFGNVTDDGLAYRLLAPFRSAGLRFDRLELAVHRAQLAVAGRALLQRIPLEQLGIVIADQFARRAARPRAGGAVHIEYATAVLVHHQDGVRRTVEQQSITFLAAANAVQHATRHPQPQADRDGRRNQDAAEQHPARPDSALRDAE